MKRDKWARGRRKFVFNRNARAQKRRYSNDNGLFAKAPSTREELGRREAARAQPRAAARLTPGNRTEQYVHEKQARENEKRIRRIRRRLAKRRQKARDDFGRAR